MNAREKALHGLGQFLEDAEYNMDVPEYEYKTADFIYGIIYEDNVKAWGDWVSREYDAWEDLQDYLPQKVADDIVTWGIY